MSTIFSILSTIPIVTIAFIIWVRQEGLLRKYFWPAFLLKLTAGIMLGLLYTYHYTTGDTFVFYSDSLKLSSLARNDFLGYLKFLWDGNELFSVWDSLHYTQPRSLFLVKVMSGINLITVDNYWVTSMYLSFASFWGAWFLVRNIVRVLPDSTVQASFAFLFFPSVVFWSAGVLKESLAMGSLFFLSGVFVKLMVRVKVPMYQWCFAAILFIILWKLKYYYAAVFLPVAVTALIVKYSILTFIKPRSFITVLVIWLFVFSLPLIIVTFFHPNFYPVRFLNVIVENNEAFHKLSDEEDLIGYWNLEPQIESILLNAPWAFISGLFRPFIWEFDNLLKALVAIENLLLAFLFFTSLTRARLLNVSPHQSMVAALMVYSFVLCTFLALSTPNVGTLSRYRIGFLPFLIFLITYRNVKVDQLVQWTQRRFPYLVR